MIGLAPTNAVAQTMKEEGFAKSPTVHAELFRLKNGRAQWDRRTIVGVDAAARMDTAVTGAGLAALQRWGRKILMTYAAATS